MAKINCIERKLFIGDYQQRGKNQLGHCWRLQENSNDVVLQMNVGIYTLLGVFTKLWIYSVLLSNSTENVQSQKSHVWRRQHTNRFLKSKSNSFKIIVNTSNLIWSSCIMQCLVGCPQNFLPIKISSVCTDVSKFSFKNRISIEWEMMRYTLIAKIRIYKFSAKEANIIRSSLTIHRCLLIRRF